MVHIIDGGGHGSYIPVAPPPERPPKIKPGKGGSNRGGGGNALSVALGTITIPNTTGQQSYNIGFTPKLLIMWGYGNTLDTDSPNGFEFPFGAASGINNQFCQSASTQDNSTSNAAQRLATRIYSVQHVTSSTAPIAVANLISFDAQGFTLDWTTTPGLARYCFYLALGGGGNAFEAFVDDWVFTTGTGALNITGVPFTPTCAIHVGGETANLNTGTNDGQLAIGAMTSGNQWACGFTQDDGVAIPDSARFFRADRCLHLPASNTGISYYARRTSFNSDGCTIAKDDPPTANSRCFSIFLKGINIAVGNTTKPTGAAPATLTISGLSFTPKAMITVSHCGAVQGTDTGITTAVMTIGAAISGVQRAATARGYDSGGVESVQASRRMSETKVYNMIQHTDGVVTVAGATTALTSDGATISFDPNDATAAGIGYIFFG